MKNKINIATFLVVVLSLAGCASGPTFQEYAASIPEVPAESGRIYIYRTAVVGAAIQPKIRVNGEVAGKAVPKGFFFIDRPAGSYEVTAKTEAKRSLTLNLEAGEARYVRLDVKMGLFAGHIKPVLVDNAIGGSEIEGTKFVGE